MNDLNIVNYNDILTQINNNNITPVNNIIKN
jgi:hypothetical protein